MHVRHVEGFGTGTFEDCIAHVDADLQGVARALRALVASVHPGVVEVCWPKQKNVGYGVGPKKNSEQFCYIGAKKSHVDLGFYEGTSLPDPDGLLEGTGASMRHVKVRDLAGVSAPALRALLTAAADRKRS